MKKHLIPFLCIFCLSLGAYAQSSLNKTCKIISFRIENSNPGLPDEAIVKPLVSELTRIFRFTDTEIAAGKSVEWRSNNLFDKVKKITKAELNQLSDNPTEVLMKVKIEHRYNAVLGGLIKKSKRHVMRLKIAMFTNRGERVWYLKKKASCCIDFNTNENEMGHAELDSSSLMDLYIALLKKAFKKL